MDLATVAAELYSLLPGEFTAARNMRAKEVGRSGDKELAKQIRQLPKPSTSAWLVNMLVAQRREEIDEVLELGASLRQAQEDLDQKKLKELTDQRHRLLASVVKDGRELAGELGQKVSESVATEVEQTLRAAMADADAADAVASGQLTRSLSSTGWEPVDLSGAVAVPEAVPHTAVAPKPSKRRAAGKDKEKDAADSSAAPEPEPKQDREPEQKTGKAKKAERDSTKAKHDERAAEKAAEAKEQERRRKQARSELDEAERRVEEAESEQESTDKRHEHALSRQEQLESEIAELKKRLRKLERESKDADREIGSLEDEKDDAVRAAKDARREAGRARRRLNDVS